MKFTLILAAFVLTVVSAAAEENDPLLVPRPVLEFMMGCKKRSLSDEDEQLVPVYRTDISAESGTTSQHVSLLGVDELQASLKAAIESDDMTDHIMNRLRQEFRTEQGPPSSFRQECPVTHTINIDVPPQELEVFHTRMERVMQQNNNILLGLINDMISTKFTNVQRDLSKLINDRIDNLDSKIGEILGRLPAPEASPAANLSDEDASADSAVTESPKPQPDNSKQDDPHETNAFVEIVQAIKAANTIETTKVANQDEASKGEDEGHEDRTTETTSASSDAHDSIDTTTKGPGRTSMQGEGNKFISNLSQLLQRPVAFER